MRLDNAAPDKTVVSLSSSCAYRLLLILQIKQWCYSTVESNMLNDKRIKSCLSRSDSGAYSRLQFLRAVSHTVAHTESLQPRDDNSTAAAVARTKTRTGRRPCQQRQLQGRRNRQRQPRQQPRTTVAKCASWRHVLASHYFIVCPNVDERADQLSLPHVGITKTKRNRTTNMKPISRSYNTPCSKHKLVVSIYSNIETSLAMSTFAIWCSVVRPRDVRSRDFGHI